MKGDFMFDYVKDKEFLSRMRNLCGEIMQDFCHCLKEDYDIGAGFFLVGSGARNLIVQNASLPIDLDHNLEIVRCEDFEDCRFLKECARKSFNKALKEHGWGDCNDSTSSLTTEKRHFLKGNPTEFSMDVCIVCRDTEEDFYRLIHKKQGGAIMTNIIGTKPLILRAYRKRLSISRKGENGSLSGRSIWILKTDTCNGTTMTIPLSFAISKP